MEFQKALTTALPNMDSPTAGRRIVVSAIAPMHGPVVRSSVVELLRQYRCGGGPGGARAPAYTGFRGPDGGSLSRV